MTTHVLIGCSASKRAHSCSAEEIYTGDLFRLSLRWAHLHGGKVWILSALHGLIPAEKVIAPYDAVLDSAEKRNAWTVTAAAALLDVTVEGDEIHALAGTSYCGWRDVLVDEFRSVSMPLEHLGIGHRKQRLAEEIDLMAHPWWDCAQVELNCSVLASLRVLWILRDQIAMSSASARDKQERELLRAINAHHKLIDVYANLGRPSAAPSGAAAPQLSLFEMAGAA